MRDFLAQLNQALERSRDCVYCAVVETRGSTPQKAGAAMLVFADGSQTGTLGGGCVEAEVKRQALRTLADGGADGAGAPGPRILSFCLDDNYGWDDGLICGGRMSILADPVAATHRRPAAAGYYRAFGELTDQGRGCTEAVVMAKTAGAPAGSRYLFGIDGALIAALGPAPAAAALREQLIPLAKRPKPWVHHGVSYLPVLPRVALFIVGGGHVGQAVAKLAGDVDFDIWVLDDREAYASAERFPTAEKRLVGDIGQVLRELAPKLTPSVYALIVTRGHAHDEEALYHLATTSAGYVGMIGSKRKIKLIYEDLLARGIAAETLAKVHAPLGFDIGSQTVPEIAVSIVAELIACRNRGATISAARIQVKI
ncbi:MAG: XdhC family protein [Gemmataceae bacterium]|nr:XdhC family protein [Gemmataceae bacterium]